jgi:hypothetical protein
VFETWFLGPGSPGQDPLLPYSVDFNVLSVTYNQDANGNGFLLLGGGHSMNLYLTLIQMAYLVQFAEQTGKTLFRYFEVDQSS